MFRLAALFIYFVVGGVSMITVSVIGFSDLTSVTVGLLLCSAMGAFRVFGP